MEITKITPQAKSEARVNLYVDGRFYCGLDRLIALKLGLKPGLTLTPKLLDKLTTDQAENSGWEWALRTLQISPKSEWEMRQKLSQKYPSAMVNDLMDRLKTLGLIDDQKLAEQLIHRYTDQGTKSQKEILQKLLAKGIAGEVVKPLLNTPDTNLRASLKLAQIKNRGLAIDLPWRTRYEKIATYLVRKGFNYTEIKQVVTPANLNLDTD